MAIDRLERSKAIAVSVHQPGCTATAVAVDKPVLGAFPAVAEPCRSLDADAHGHARATVEGQGRTARSWLPRREADGDRTRCPRLQSETEAIPGRRELDVA